MSITASTIEWAEELVETPEEDAPELDDLPDCFQWRDTLRQVTTTLRDASVLGMPAPHGALFYGPPGNGRHTLAQAYISTMWRWRQVGPEDTMGTRTFLVSTARPLMWSWCSWVTRMAVSFSGGTPSALRPVVMRRAETPASSRIWVSPQDTSAALPLDPLARVVTVSKMIPLQIN